MQERIQKVIANSGLMSRRKAEELIIAGRVFVNKRRSAIGEKVDPDKDEIVVNRRSLMPDTTKAYYALNKPKEYVVTTDDPAGRKTIYDLPAVQKIREKILPVGRLDLMTEGLLLLSNDGEFINKATHPSFSIEKEYYVRVEPGPTREDIRKLEKGIVVDGRRTTPAHVRRTGEREVLLTIHEGRNRIVRKMMESLNYKIYALRRVRVGRINLGSLAPGEVRKLTPEEVAWVKGMARKGRVHASGRV